MKNRALRFTKKYYSVQTDYYLRASSHNCFCTSSE